jgi:hypothetical protein
MAVNLNGDSITVWKFRETGLVALCQEVVEFATPEMIEHYNLDADKAYFVGNDGETINIVFPVKK